MDYQEVEAPGNSQQVSQETNIQNTQIIQPSFQQNNQQQSTSLSSQQNIPPEDYTQIQEIPSSEGPKKGLWVALFIGIFILLFLILFVASMQHDSTTISKNEIIKGDEVEAKENNSLRFKFGDEEHNIKIGFLGAGSVDLVIESEPIQTHILINETQFFDINNDGENDLRIKLQDIKYGKAILLVKRVDKDYCVPNWQCGNWGDCSDNIKKRKCFDISECGRISSTPKQEIFCVNDSVNLSEFIGEGELSCSQNNATICNSSEKCSGYFINSSDSLRCCLGNCIPFQLNGSIYSISCNKEISSFKEASDNCTFFSMNCSEDTFFPALGLLREINSTFEIQGYSSGSCIIYYQYTNSSVNYSNEKFQELLEKGKTFEQINFEVEALASGFYNLYLGKNITCYYPVNDLKIFLYKWETGKETWSLDVLGKYECRGNLGPVSSNK